MNGKLLFNLFIKHNSNNKNKIILFYSIFYNNHILENENFTFNQLMNKIELFSLKIMNLSINKNIDCIIANLNVFYLKLKQRSINSIILLLCCLKLNVTFFPIDTNCPIKRIEKLCKYIKNYIIISENEIDLLNSYSLNSFLSIDNISIKLFKSNPICDYIVLSSGSTNEPKSIILL